jgi:hypothetical protein
VTALRYLFFIFYTAALVGVTYAARCRIVPAAIETVPESVMPKPAAPADFYFRPDFQ